MKIEIASWHEAMVFVLTLIAILSAAATLHWKVVAEPMLKKIFAPFIERVDVVSRVVRRMHPEEFKDAENTVLQERGIRRAI